MPLPPRMVPGTHRSSSIWYLRYTRAGGPHSWSNFCGKGNISAPTSNMIMIDYDNKPLSDMERRAGKSLWALQARGLKIEMELFHVHDEHLN